MELSRRELDCRVHAKHCTRCFVPIIDDEGNPGYLSEACPQGRDILKDYIDYETNIFRS